MVEKFVNPYTFVPLPPGLESPDRRPPNWHLGDPDLLSGLLTIRIKAETRLLIRGFGTDEKPVLPRRADGRAFVPGSSVKGALRSLHETLTGSCLRVFDAKFFPTYRDTARNRGRLLALVEHPGDPEKADSPPTVRLCKPSSNPRTHRIDQEDLEKLARTEGLVSGDRVHFQPAEKGRLAQVVKADNGNWVVFISDERNPGERYKAHVRELDDKRADVTPAAWQDFLHAVKDTDDQRNRRATENAGKVTEEVRHKYAPKDGAEREVVIGERYLSSPALVAGQPVWVELNGSGDVVWLGLAMLWRHVGAHPSGERAREFQPCDTPEALCPSCRLFGSIEPRDPDLDAGTRDRAEQNSYRGHVRFGDAVAAGDVAGEPTTLPPMGAPRPGAGQFYLRNDVVEGQMGEPPLREWGSKADQPEPREIRGRKYYWHTPKLNGREKAQDGQNDEMTSKAVLFPAGTEFRADLAFTDIDAIQLGSLIAALSPSVVLERPGLRQHFGGGRPLGYGGCTVDIDFEKSWARSSGSRYGAQGQVLELESDAEKLVAQFRESVPELAGTTWKRLAKALDPDAVKPEQVRYPPVDETGDENGFAFWRQTSGEEGAKDARFPLKSLPGIDAEDQTLQREPHGGQPPRPGRNNR
ncbi:TIGR03986 family CRISPR-associated RAMP protein [Saccharopolyspora shandongensis]|uniref:TIGR03986 family type III CRISPR-associated RAMP protein n=1 Tax=Saccharopolyspora shandongensis TaxID=418495 RepID=UPI0034213422